MCHKQNSKTSFDNVEHIFDSRDLNEKLPKTDLARMYKWMYSTSNFYSFSRLQYLFDKSSIWCSSDKMKASRGTKSEQETI